MLVEMFLMAFTVALIAWPIIWLRRIERRAERERLIDDIEKFLQDH